MSLPNTLVLTSGLLSILCSGIAVGQYSNRAPDQKASYDNTRTDEKQRIETQPDPAPSMAPLIFWQQNRLPIPFNIKSTTGASEVQLYVSADRGAHWQLYDRKVPAARRFLFRAPRDGEFWFASRTLHQNETAAGTPKRPELRVVVDTLQPDFALNSLVDPSGKVQTTWEISDEYLKTSSFKLQYQPLGGASWIPIAIDQKVAAPESTTRHWNGQWLWWPETKSRSLVLRGSVEDEAGNRATQTVRLFLPAVALRRPPPNATPAALATSRLANSSNTTKPRFGKSNSFTETPPASRSLQRDSWPADPEAEQFISTTVPPTTNRMTPERRTFHHPANAISSNRENLPAKPDIASQAPSSNAYNTPSTNRRPDIARPSVTRNGNWATTPENEFPRDDTQAEALPSPAPTATRNGNWATTPENDQQDRSTAWQPANVSPTGTNKSPPASASKRQTTAGYRPGSLDSGHSYQPSATPRMPVSPDTLAQSSLQPYMTHSRRFQLDYDINAIALANVSQVELWATTDQGRLWQKWGHDKDCRSPLEVEVNDPGTYGFRIVIVGRNGVAGNTPAAGADADVWVTVDHTPPEVKLLAVQTGQGAKAGHLVIQWDASDRHLAERPITLRAAESANGPWTIIAEGLQNMSEFAWRPPATIARQIYLQIEARDAAGNHATDQTHSPVDVRSATPRGRIRGFRSLQE